MEGSCFGIFYNMRAFGLKSWQWGVGYRLVIDAILCFGGSLEFLEFLIINLSNRVIFNLNHVRDHGFTFL